MIRNFKYWERPLSFLDTFQANHPDITIYEFDVYAFLQDAANDPGSYGFTNATQVCPAYYRPSDFDNSAGYVFWDTIHPTTETHEEVANQILSVLPDDNSDGSSDDDSTCFINSMLSF
jgi:phospholipase/lecithinase/hemolysin